MKKKFSFKLKNFYKNDSICVSINDYEYFFEQVVTIYQALLEKGWYIPRFCYHVKLALSGNCRMCFVEKIDTHKPVVACATLINNNMSILTSSSIVFKAREGILEFLLINHPIDCPVCDQGGECDLQDQYIVMGSLLSRYYEKSKKSVINKNLSFLIKLSLNKCINCTRCTRYSQNVTGDYSFSLLGRGENSVISNYCENIYVGEITGNVMDLCPVGALTSKLISYDFRLWELIDLKYLDFLDVMHPPIRIDFRGLKILRILPLSNNVIQEEWISDKLRYNFKSLFKYRFFLPYIKKNSYYVMFSWSNSFSLIKNNYIKIINFYCNKKSFYLKSFFLCENTTDLYKYFLYKHFFKKFSFYNKNLKETVLYNTFRNNYLIDNKDLDFLSIENFFFYNVNLRYELPLLNFKIREKLIFDYISVYLFGPVLELNYFFIHLGNSLKIIFSNFLKIINFKNGDNVFFYSVNNKLYNAVLFILHKIKKKINFYNISNLNNIKLLKNEYNFQKNFFFNSFKNNFSITYKNNGNSFFTKNNFLNSKQFTTLYTQNIFNVKNYFLILPSKFNFEQNSVFLNIFGIYNDFTFLSYKSNHKTLKNDWSILESLFKSLKLPFKFSLNKIKKNFIPSNWIFSEYNLNLYMYRYFTINLKIYNINTYLIVSTPSFFNDTFSKNNTLFQYFNKIKKFNIFNYFSKINSIYWIF